MQMAKRFFDKNEDRIKRWIERRYDFNPTEEITFDEFYQEFPIDSGYNEPTLELFIEEYLYNFIEQHTCTRLCSEMVYMFDMLLEEMELEVVKNECFTKV